MLSRKTIAALKVKHMHIATKGRPLKTCTVKVNCGTAALQ